jgi:tripartite-type tricarboxylate transporter receptor subunit TctC
MRLRLTGYLLPLIAVLSATAVQAQTFPSRTVTIVSPYQAAGTSDIIARILAT